MTGLLKHKVWANFQPINVGLEDTEKNQQHFEVYVKFINMFKSVLDPQCIQVDVYFQ